MSSSSLGLSLAPDDFLGASLAYSDLNDSGGSAGRVGADGDSEVFSETVLELGGWASISSCSTVFNLNR